MAIVGGPNNHFHFRIPEGSTSVRRSIYFALDTGEPDAGLVEGDFLVSAESQFAYFRDDAAASVEAAADGTNTLATATTLGTWEDGGIKAIDATKLPGWYEIGFPDAAFVKTVNGVGQANVVFQIQADDASTTQPVQVTFELTKAEPAPSIQRHVRKANAVNVRENVFFADILTGVGKTGLSKTSFTVADAAELAYYRGDAAAAVDAKFDATTALGDATTLGTWETATIKEISSALMPGWYEVNFPNAMFIINQASGVKPRAVSVTIKPELAANVGTVNVLFELYRSVAR
jgi:hypothetical protein